MIIALLCGAVAGVGAAALVYDTDVRKTTLYGFGVLAATTLFVLKIKSALGLFQTMVPQPEEQ